VILQEDMQQYKRIATEHDARQPFAKHVVSFLELMAKHVSSLELRNK
jgi:hypothetical protein